MMGGSDIAVPDGGTGSSALCFRAVNTSAGTTAARRGRAVRASAGLIGHGRHRRHGAERQPTRREPVGRWEAPVRPSSLACDTSHEGRSRVRTRPPGRRTDLGPSALASDPVGPGPCGRSAKSSSVGSPRAAQYAGRAREAQSDPVKAPGPLPQGFRARTHARAQCLVRGDIVTSSRLDSNTRRGSQGQRARLTRARSQRRKASVTCHRSNAVEVPALEQHRADLPPGAGRSVGSSAQRGLPTRGAVRGVSWPDAIASP